MQHPAQARDGDSVSFELGPHLEHVRTDVLDPGDRRVIIGPGGEDGSVVAAVDTAQGAEFGTGPALTERDGLAVVRQTDTGYQVEASWPWEVLGVDAGDPGEVFVTNLNVSDAIPSGDRRGELNTLQTNNPARTTDGVTTRHRWGTLELVDDRPEL